MTLAADIEKPIQYIKRTREYYLALGYDNPYSWAHFDTVPFTQLKKPLDRSTIGIVTTAATYNRANGNQAPGAPYNGKAKFFKVYEGNTATTPDLRNSHIAIDRDNITNADINSYFPLSALKRAEAKKRIGKCAAQFYGLPTNRSQKTTIDIDCHELVERSLKNSLDIAILAPNCPVCHQSVSLAARALESVGIPTVIMGCALDIVEHVGVPRFLFSDFPLGNACGKPGDQASQDDTLEQALRLLETATEARATRHSPQRWAKNNDWKQYYSNHKLLSQDELKARRAAFDQAKTDVKK